MTRIARHERAQHAGFQINLFDLKSVLYCACIRLRTFGNAAEGPLSMCRYLLFRAESPHSEAVPRRRFQVSHGARLPKELFSNIL